MMNLTSLDGVLVRRQEGPTPVRLLHPKWWRIDRHLAWLMTPKEKRAIVTIRFLGNKGSIVSRDVRAIAE